MVGITKRKIIAVILAIMSILFCSISFKLTASAEETTAYTDVLEDLQKDDSFKIENYPANTVKKISVIQIAESSDKELFIYVYEPCYKTEKYNVDKIRLGDVEIGIDTEYKDYDLTLLNSNGVFFKYKVEDFTVRESNVRYYDVVHILVKLDEPYKNLLGQIITHDKIAIKQKWQALTVNGETTYKYEYLQTVTLPEKFVGFVRYNDGYKFHTSKECDAHFVAFSTDKKIEDLHEVSLTFVTKNKSVSIYNNGFTETINESLGKENPKEEIVFKGEMGDTSGDFWFSKKKNWNRISTTAIFLEESEGNEVTFTNQANFSFAQTDWVINFYETSFTSTSYVTTDPISFVTTTTTYIESIIVSSVSILRLKFVTDGKTYNLGVVDNYQTGSSEPVGTVSPQINLDGLWDMIQKAISLVLIIVVGGVILAILAPFIPMIVKGIVLVFTWIIKGVWWVICLPFKLIGKLFKRKDS